MHLEVFQSLINDQWYVRLVGGNGEKMMVSEEYDNKDNAERAAHRIREYTIGEVLEVEVIN